MTRISPEAAVIRSKLAVRWNVKQDSYEVYTTTHGSGIYKWYQVCKNTAQWYMQNFNLKLNEPYHE